MSSEQDFTGSIQLEILTPSRRKVDLSVASVTMPGAEGYFGVLPGHMPLITKLKPGVITYEEGGMPRRVAVSQSVVEVVPERVIVLARSAEFSGDIDVERAKSTLAEARKKMESLAPEDPAQKDAEQEEQRALARIQAVEEQE